jgi:hypothetical protein
MNARNQRAIGAWASSAYESLAGQVLNAGAISAKNIASGSYSSALIGTVTGVLGGLGNGIMMSR